MKYKIFVKDVPEARRIWSHIETVTNVTKYYTMKSDCDATDLITLPHRFDLNRLTNAVLEAVEKFKPRGWLSKQGFNTGYGGLSLTMNPQYIEDVDPSYQTLGTERNEPHQFYYDHMDNFETLKNTYFDSLGFRVNAPCTERTDLKNILSQFKRPSIRSRIGIITSNWDEKRRATGGWHRDEQIFENLRINVPITTDPTYMFQIINKQPVHLPCGNMYSWDTNIPHRVFPTTMESKTRIHLVFGFCPWFDYVEEEDAFVSNEFYGEMHPFDMLLSGHVHSDIGVHCSNT